MPCSTSANQLNIDQSLFWDDNGVHWTTHRIGWAIAGGCAALTTLVSTISILQHCRNYTNPAQQRQILRILYMPVVYAVISFCSYRFFREYVYYSFIQVAYEAITLSAFLLLIIDYVASTASNHSAEKALERKDKKPLPMPFCCWRYRPTKAYFMYTVKWSVLQYVIIRPAASIAGIICEHYNVLCESGGYSPHFASVYIEAIDFVSISVALYGLLMFYGLVHEELEGRRPLSKFLSIKLIVMFTFYQGFMIKAFQSKIKPTPYWSTTNIANGLNALAICIEMVFFSCLMWWAYPVTEYKRKGVDHPTSIWRPLWDSINYADFITEIWGSFRFFYDFIRGKPTAHGHGHRVPTIFGEPNTKMDFGQAFGVGMSSATYIRTSPSQHAFNEQARNSAAASGEHIVLDPYPFGPSQTRV